MGCHAAMVVPGGTPEIASWAEGVIKRIKDRTKQAYFTENLREALQIPAKADQGLTIAAEQEIYKRMAEAQGINLADSSDQIAKIVNIGIADFDPTRVLRNCRIYESFKSEFCDRCKECSPHSPGWSGAIHTNGSAAKMSCTKTSSLAAKRSEPHRRYGASWAFSNNQAYSGTSLA